MSKGRYLFSAISGVLLNLVLMLLPSILSGVQQSVLSDPRLITFLLIISFWVILAAGDSDREIIIPGQQRQARWLPYLMSAAMLSVFLTSLTERALNEVTPLTILAIAGGVTMLVGILLRRLAIRRLGAYFLDDVVIASGQELVTAGIYSRVRHPSETGNLCIAFGCPLLLGSPIGLVVSTLILLPVVLIRIRLEDRLLMQHYLGLFSAYSRDVPALFGIRLLIFWDKSNFQ